MNARKVLENAALGSMGGPQARIRGEPQRIEFGRIRLANAVLSAHSVGITGADAIKAHALRSLQLRFEGGTRARVCSTSADPPLNRRTVVLSFDPWKSGPKAPFL